MNEELDASSVEETGIVMPGQVSQPEEIKTDSESSPDSGDNHEKKHDGVQERINKITADKYAAQRERDDLQRQLNEAKSNPVVADVKASDVDAPVLPDDLYDDEAMRKYHAETTKYHAQVAQDAAKSTFEQQQRNTTEQAEKAKQQTVIQNYANNAIRDGVDMEKLRVAEQAINQAGVNQQLAEYIMNDANGGKIIETLYDNPALMHEVLSMDPISAGMKIAQEVKPLALSKTKNVSNAPAPVAEVKGGGVFEQDEFEKNYPGAQFI